MHNFRAGNLEKKQCYAEVKNIRLLCVTLVEKILLNKLFCKIPGKNGDVK